MQNVYAFIKDPSPLENYKSAPIYKIMEKLNNGKKLNYGKDEGWDGWKHKDESGRYITKPGYKREDNDLVCFTDINGFYSSTSGIYKLMGYNFDFRNHFKKYLVKTKYSGWQEKWGYNKTFIREISSHPHEILQILELKD